MTTVWSGLLAVAVLAAAGWFWSFLYRGEKSAFHCVGCGKCVAAGECVLMKEERERKLALEKKREMKKTPRQNGKNKKYFAEYLE